MRLWILDNGGIAARERVATAAELGFERWIARYDHPKLKSLAEWCLRYNIGLMVDMAYWGDNFKRDHPGMAFRNHDGLSSFASRDPIVVANDWPSFWHPTAVAEIMEPAFNHAMNEVGDALVGFAIGTGTGDATVMPINWHRCPNGSHFCQDYWVFDEHALKAYKKMYGADAVPAAHPVDDENLETLRFIQDGLVGRLNEVAKLAAANGSEVFPMILPFPNNSYINMAAGYSFGLHGKLATWAHTFADEHDVHVGFLIPYVFGEGNGGLQDQIACAASMADPMGNNCETLVGAEVGGSDWEKNLIRNGGRVPKLGLHGLLCDPTYVTDPSNKDRVKDILLKLSTA